MEFRDMFMPRGWSLIHQLVRTKAHLITTGSPSHLAFILHCAPMNVSKPAHCWKPQPDSEFHVGIRKHIVHWYNDSIQAWEDPCRWALPAFWFLSWLFDKVKAWFKFVLAKAWRKLLASDSESKNIECDILTPCGVSYCVFKPSRVNIEHSKLSVVPLKCIKKWCWGINLLAREDRSWLASLPSPAN